MEVKVGRLAEVEPLLHNSYDEHCILFCQNPLILKEAFDYLYLFFDQPRDLAPSVFEVCLVDLDALFERAAFFLCTFPGEPLPASPTFLFRPLEGFRRMLFWHCAE